VVVDPPDGHSTTEGAVIVRGLAQPGSTITRDVPMWFDEQVLADGSGTWSFPLALRDGENTFTFRIDDDLSTAQTLTIYRLSR
jgi:hypothetical protein